MSKPEVNCAPPYDVNLSPQVSARFGFKDGHVELVVQLPFPLSTIKKTYAEKFTLEELRELKKAVDKAAMWGELPDYQRERDGA